MAGACCQGATFGGSGGAHTCLERQCVCRAAMRFGPCGQRAPEATLCAGAHSRPHTDATMTTSAMPPHISLLVASLRVPHSFGGLRGDGGHLDVGLLVPAHWLSVMRPASRRLASRGGGIQCVGCIRHWPAVSSDVRWAVVPGAGRQQVLAGRKYVV